jgi:hypothetical protein
LVRGVFVLVAPQRLFLLTAFAIATAGLAQGGFASSQSRGHHRVGSAGVTVALPRSWHSLPLALPPGLKIDQDPVARIAVSSGPISFGRGCGDTDYAFPSTAVALVVLEYVRLKTGPFPPRPQKFTPRNLRLTPSPAIECFNGPAASIEFADHGRRFDVFLLLGRHAPLKLADRARAVLDTLTVRTVTG